MNNFEMIMKTIINPERITRSKLNSEPIRMPAIRKTENLNAGIF